jgi:hypothetical protein
MRDKPDEPSIKGKRLLVLADLASGSLATFRSQFSTLTRAFPDLLVVRDGPPMLALSPFESYDDYSIEMIRALASAGSRGLDVITPLMSSGSSSTKKTVGSTLFQHNIPMMSLVICMTYCNCYMNLYRLNSSSKQKDTQQDKQQHKRRIQVELAVAAKSAGVCRAHACSCSTAAGVAAVAVDPRGTGSPFFERCTILHALAGTA